MITFADALIWHLTKNKTVGTDLAKETSVSLDVIKKLRTHRSLSTSAENATKIAAYYGESVPDFLAIRSSSKENEIFSLFSPLSEYAQDFVFRQIQGLVIGRGAKEAGA